MGISERQKEIKRRRHRRAKVTKLKERLAKATVSEKGEIVRKLRGLTPGADELVAQFGLDEVDR
ncbi:MAG: hypothetical protein KDA42_03820 [Planctomycetales bacterium]|nr:hypothetical protein [Planctomycetales bacterium]